MAQVYKMMLGTSGRQWELLTVKDDGTMTMTFHGTDREISHEVTENEGGWLCCPGAMFPGLESGKWVLTDEEPIVTVAAKPTLRGQAPCNPPSATHTGDSPRHTGDSPREPRPRRQRKARKAAAPVRRSIETSRQRDIEMRKPTTGNEWLLSAGYLAAATVALLVIYETGLLIPLGLIGLATGGILK